ncbi:AbrB/MazE/SpoVT family DNA-binding domain-containing protein [Microbacterium sp.]|uniref:AbrB/MazE/SpoVT family DNA-binding domain-containing protein n=1 Tax=Microbacterium sp. TaxID=51671 RepID=UPI003C733614
MKIDSSGRLTIPAALRRRYGLRPGDEIQFHADGDDLVMVPVIDRSDTATVSAAQQTQ